MAIIMIYPSLADCGERDSSHTTYVYQAVERKTIRNQCSGSTTSMFSTYDVSQNTAASK